MAEKCPACMEPTHEVRGFIRCTSPTCNWQLDLCSETCVCGYKRKDHLNNKGVLLKSGDCLLFRKRENG